MNNVRPGAKKRLLFLILRTARALGLFTLARRLTAGQLRILTYHGAALADENAFRGGLFMSKAVFDRRMAMLADQAYPILPLGKALERLEADALPACATVITIDDGWWSTAAIMVPTLKRHAFPATLYVSTYYVAKQTLVFNVALAYVLWRCETPVLDTSAIAPALQGRFSLDDEAERDAATQLLCDHGDTLAGAPERQALLARVCELVDVDMQALQDARMFTYMTFDEALALRHSGIDLQLHTHRHRLPDASQAAMQKEIDDNREALEPVASSPLRHLCYPSGEYTDRQLPWLAQAGLDSATTVKPGFNTRHTPTLELRRFLDWDQITDIEFEAEMCGFLELIRRCGYAI